MTMTHACLVGDLGCGKPCECEGGASPRRTGSCSPTSESDSSNVSGRWKVSGFLDAAAVGGGPEAVVDASVGTAMLLRRRPWLKNSRCAGRTRA